MLAVTKKFFTKKENLTLYCSRRARQKSQTAEQNALPPFIISKIRIQTAPEQFQSCNNP